MENGLCRRNTCIARWQGDQRIAVIGRFRDEAAIEVQWIEYDAKKAEWRNAYNPPMVADEPDELRLFQAIDTEKAVVSTRELVLEQLVVDGQPVGEPYRRP